MRARGVSVRIDPDLKRRLREEAFGSGKSESEVVREALEDYLAGRRRRETCYELAHRIGLLGCIRNAPPDSSTNRKHPDGFGTVAHPDGPRHIC